MISFSVNYVRTVKFYAVLYVVDPCNTGWIIIHGYVPPSKGFKIFCNQIELHITQCYEQYNLSFYKDGSGTRRRFYIFLDVILDIYLLNSICNLYPYVSLLKLIWIVITFTVLLHS